jgi:hypothetical protein
MLVRAIHYGLIAVEKSAAALGVDQVVLDVVRGARKILGVGSLVGQLEPLRNQITEWVNPTGGEDCSPGPDEGETG